MGVEILEDRVTPSTFQVTNALDPTGPPVPGSVRFEMALANGPGNAGSTVEITPGVTAGTIALHAGELPISSNMTIVNNSGHPIEIHQATAGARVFDITGRLTIQVTIQGGSAATLLTIDGGSVTNGSGGGIAATNPLNVLTLSFVNVVNNAAAASSSGARPQPGSGGGIFTSGTLILDHSVVGTIQAPNRATGIGGGIWAGKGVTMSASSITGNTATLAGGGIAVGLGNVTLSDGSSVSNNTTAGTGGGIALAAGTITLSASQVNANAATSVGGILDGTGSIYVLKGSQVNANTSSSTGGGGGGIADVLGSVYVSASQVSNNLTHGMFSGGIVVLLGSVSAIDASQVDRNSNNGPGGGIAANFLGTVTVAGGSQVNGNTGAGIGGGIVNFSGQLGAINITGGSQVNNNKLTNGETIAEVIAAFLSLIKKPGFGGFSVLAGGQGGARMQAALKRTEKMARQASTLLKQSLRQHLSASKVQVAGGGIGTLLGSPVAITGSSQVSGNTSGVPVTGSPAVGIAGGLFALRGTITINGGLVNNNTATAGGGGIWSAGTLTITDSTLAGNKAAGGTTPVQGGGLLNARGGRATVQNSVISGNQGGFGGGMANLGFLTVLDTTITHNTATNTGGGIWNIRKLIQLNNTFAGNTPNDVVGG